MSEAILRYKLPEDHEEFDTVLQAGEMKAALWAIGEEIFRPARKHGYPERDIGELVTKIGPDAEELIGLLEKKFYDIIHENNISL